MTKILIRLNPLRYLFLLVIQPGQGPQQPDAGRRPLAQPGLFPPAREPAEPGRGDRLNDFDMLLWRINHMDFDWWRLQLGFRLAQHINAGITDMRFATIVRIYYPGRQQSNPDHPGKKLHQFPCPCADCQVIPA